MSQPSVTRYFNTRKRAAQNAVLDPSAKEVLVLEQNSTNGFKGPPVNLKGHPDEPKIILANTMAKKTQRNAKKSTKAQQNCVFTEAAKEIKSEIREIVDVEGADNLQKCSNAMDKVKITGSDVNFSELKQKLSRSSRLKELKASLNRCKKLEEKAKEIKEEIKKSEANLNSKESRKVELENRLSSEAAQQTKTAKPAAKEEQTASNFTLPYKYRYLMEIFRSMDIACQILHNRSETITFRKLKPAVEEMLRRNLLERHLAQIKTIYPDAFCFAQEKHRVFGGGLREERWELVVKPNLRQDAMSSEVILERRRKFEHLLLEEAHKQHEAFLQKLGLKLPREKLKSWHPEFNLDNVPDIESSELPKPVEEEKFSTGKEVLEKAKELFKTNPKMQAAFERLHAAKQKQESKDTPEKPKKALKGIPQALLEKVRQKQAAKALENMTRCPAKEKEIEMYQKLPDIARLTRNLFVSERKNVLPLETVVDKLGNSFRTYMNRVDMEVHLKTLAKEAPDWLIFHEVRSATFVKLDKSKDVTVIVDKLEATIKEKTAV